MLIPEFESFRSSLTPDDRNTLSALVDKVASLSLNRGLVPTGSDLATRIHTASRTLTTIESKALAAYVFAGIASLPTTQQTVAVPQSTAVQFADKLRVGTGTALSGSAETAGSLSTFLPGGAVIAASVQQIGSTGQQMSNLSNQPGASQGPSTIAGNTSSPPSQSQLMQDTQAMQELQMSFNLQYLQLQNSMQNENRRFSMVSNIMKTKHDTVKNIISNIH